MSDGIALTDYRYGEMDVEDAELLETVAKLEGALLWDKNKDKLRNYIQGWDGMYFKDHQIWNPLTKDAQAFQLLVKYQMELRWAFDREVWRAVVYEPAVGISGTGQSESAAKAICLAIVEAKGE